MMDADKRIFEGYAIGGPLDEQLVQSRFPRGFVLVNKPERRAWIYDMGVSRANRTIFTAREPDGRPLDDALRWAAAEGSDWDVRAA